MWIKVTSILVFCILGGIKAQIGGTISGNSYVCVPAGFCNNNGNPVVPSPGIDPRIVVPGPAPCPAGQVACYTQGPGSNCGVRFVRQISTADGNADRSAYPWQVYLRNSTNQYAGSGVLLDNYRVLTAAHKVYLSRTAPATVTVFVGVYTPADLRTNVQNRTVSNITLHPMFDSRTLKNDLAILTLSSPIMLSSNNVNTACLPAVGASYVGAQGCEVAGWGQTAFTTYDAPTNPMKQVSVSIVDINTCRTSYARPTLLGANVDLYLDTAGGELCAGGQAQRDACTQDGGSPLVCPDATGRSYIAGLVIWGKNCGQPGVYGVYLNTAYYRGWIDTTITAMNAAAG